MSTTSRSSQMEAKREEFRKYLEKEGVLEYLNRSLVSLYEADQPNNALDYLKNNFYGKEQELLQLKANNLTKENESLRAQTKELTEKVEALEKESAELREKLDAFESRKKGEPPEEEASAKPNGEPPQEPMDASDSVITEAHSDKDGAKSSAETSETKAAEAQAGSERADKAASKEAEPPSDSLPVAAPVKE